MKTTLLIPALVALLAPAAALAKAPPPAPATPPALASVSFAPATVVGGGSATGAFTFSGVPDGAVVRFASSDPAVAQVPAQTVVGRVVSGRFGVTTSAVDAPTTVTITASAYGTAASQTLTVTPGVAPAADTVKITRAEIAAGLLRIEATTDDPLAILTVHIGATARLMTSQGGGKFSDQSGRIDRPASVSVTSNFGGSATSTVIQK